MLRKVYYDGGITMKKFLLLSIMFFMSSLNSKISIETVRNHTNESESYLFIASGVGSFATFDLLGKTFKIVVTLIESNAKGYKIVGFDFFEIVDNDELLRGKPTVDCFPMHSGQHARVKYSEKNAEIENSFSFFVKEVK
jgi:hypothetical protein